MRVVRARPAGARKGTALDKRAADAQHKGVMPYSPVDHLGCADGYDRMCTGPDEFGIHDHSVPNVGVEEHSVATNVVEQAVVDGETVHPDRKQGRRADVRRVVTAAKLRAVWLEVGCRGVRPGEVDKRHVADWVCRAALYVHNGLERWRQELCLSLGRLVQVVEQLSSRAANKKTACTSGNVPDREQQASKEVEPSG